MDRESRRARVGRTSRSRQPRGAECGASFRSIHAEQEREPIAVQRRHHPGISKESDRRELQSDRLRAIPRDVLLEITGPAPLQLACDLLDRFFGFVAAAIPFTDRDLALEL